MKMQLNKLNKLETRSTKKTPKMAQRSMNGNVKISNWVYGCVILVFSNYVLCENQCPKYADRPLELRVQDATIVFRGVVLQCHRGMRIIDLALVSIYRGGVELGSICQYFGTPYNTTDRQVNLKILPELETCFKWDFPPVSELVVFAKISEPAVDLETTPADGPWLEATSSAVPWSLGVDAAIWNAVGWSGWSEWSICSLTCGGGKQTRRRYCSKPSCEGFGEQYRTCNTFDCEGSINPLTPDGRRIFHPTQAYWEAVTDRPHAFSLKPNSYIWIASSEIFSTGNSFPKEFTLFISLRLRPESGGYGQGTLFSLRSRHKAGMFLSLELAGREEARLVHAGSGKKARSIYLTVPFFDFRWHQIAISIHNDNGVRIYVDCRWLRTDILGKDSLDTPKDADLIIGYLFSGDLEQMVIVPKSEQAHKQCSTDLVDVEQPSTTRLDINNVPIY